MANKDNKPQELKAFEKKFHENTKITGMLMETTMHMPCGFCAEPDFMVYRVVDADPAMREGAICKHCKRGVKAIFHVDTPSEKRFELVQFCGPDAPRFLTAIRRIACRVCNDKHTMELDGHQVPCTQCPRPCQKCRFQGVGAFCAKTPCLCECHKEKNSGAS